MADCCNGGCASGKPPADARYRRILWIALLVNAGMFVIELASGWHAESAALLADSADFMGDALNYGISLFILGLGTEWRRRSALLKGWSMAAYGLFVLATTAWHVAAGALPAASTMSVIGVLALVANGAVAALLYAFREGDADMRAVWLCTRNDVIGNLAVLAAAALVARTGGNWPDILVAAVMGALSLTAAWAVIRRARRESGAALVRT
ncbi:cation transporter [Duganella aceris]|uniref:Cation transporter n=1 Tax=Duganella aceris TaxID=2703883 RepID=A0ABX0FTR0_9BURK|nr:cation transporter [Duganella aceris]NGZ87853.1 cation transporter [Duganella aceris]